ncbi:MAG: response regulator [Chitinispirillaceae bacterium]|jgi:CheY-like chemotaxis protein|nr:response regulator [Chitinispirillaceae bacterium]
MNQSYAEKIVDILLIEDNPGDIRLMQEAMIDARISNQLHVVSDGAEALEYLLSPGADRPTPDIIFLDLNLPRKDGREVLEAIKNNDDLKRIPVIVLTTSSSDEDIIRSYNLHANCFITKPVDPRKFMDMFLSIDHFWFTVVTLPKARIS